jgi:hypothetical protein
MSTKLHLVLLVSTALFAFAPGVALADPPDLCADEDDEVAIRTPGDFNKEEHADGTPGQVGQEGFTTASEEAHARNEERKIACPTPRSNP